MAQHAQDGDEMRGGGLLVLLLYSVLYVTFSFAIEQKLGPQEMDLSQTNLVLGAERACTACHVLNQMENSIGPHLVGVIGRPAAAVTDYAYSDAMRQADLRWTRERLREFLLNPQRVVPGTAMPAARVDEDSADAIVNFLSRQH